MEATNIEWGIILERVTLRRLSGGMVHNSDDIQKTHLSRPSTPPADVFLPGQMIGDKYKVVSLLGTGGIGSVYKVEQIFLRQEFALKTLNSGSTSEQMIRRFQNEARTASLLNHPNLVKVNDFGILESQEPYLVMDFVNGYTLSEYLKANGVMNLEQIVACFAQICLGLAYAHEQGIVHRDIKPSNIMISRTLPFGAEGFVKIVDFGIAKLVFSEDGERQALTTTGEVFGSPLYMSPEQCSGLTVDQRADVYSLGCVLFECLTGTTPFVGQNALTTMMLHQSEHSPTLREASLGKDFPPELEQLVQKMLSKAPSDRYQNLGIVANDLAQISKGGQVLGLNQAKRKSEKVAKTITLTQEKLAFYMIGTALFSALVFGPIGYFLGNKQAESARPSQSSETDSSSAEMSASEKEAQDKAKEKAALTDFNPLKDKYLQKKYDSEIDEEARKRKQRDFEKPYYESCEEMDKVPLSEKAKIRGLLEKFSQMKAKIQNDERLKRQFLETIEGKITLGYVKLGEYATAETRMSKELKELTSAQKIAANAGFYQLFAEGAGRDGNMKEAFRYYKKGADTFLKALHTPGCSPDLATSCRNNAGNFLRCASDVSLHHLHNIPQAVAVGEQARALLEKDGDDYVMANLLLTLGSALAQNKQYDRAESTLLRSERLFQTTNSKEITVPLVLSCVRLELSEARNNLNRKPEALASAKQALSSLNRFKTKDPGQKAFAAAHRNNILNQIKKLETP